MKRIIAIFTATLTLALYGCENKTVTDSPAPEQPTESAEPVFAEYTEADFTPIKMNLNITDDPPPFEIHTADLSGLDFGERLSPCKAEGEREKYDLMTVYLDDPEMQAEYEAERERFYNTPSKGDIRDTVFLDGKFYFEVNYDDLCRCHDSSIFSFDPETGEMKELVTRTGLEYTSGFNSFISAGGRLIFMEYGDDFFTVCNIDPISGEISELFTKEEETLMMQASDDGILISSIEGKGDTSKYVVKKYDIVTGEVLGEMTDEAIILDYGLLTCGGEPASAKGGSDEPLLIETAYYSLETGPMRCMGVYLWKDKVSVITDESVNNYSNERRLYTYDFARMERTEINYNGFSIGMIQTGDGFVDAVQSSGAYYSSSTAYYIAPQLGTAFRLIKSDSIRAMETGGVCCFIASGYKQAETVYGDNSVISFSNTDAVPEKLYWFEVQE